jgi:UDP-N-acetylmuramoyl-tripeptide--D-alanyl-D-alanine ligase
VLEVGIHGPGIMRRYARLVRPQIVIVTSVGSEHNPTLRSLEATRTEKAEMVRSLSRSGVALLNGDDENVRWMATQTSAAVRTFGFGPSSDVRATDVAIDWPHGTRFTLHASGETRRVRVRLLGRHMLYPVLAAVAVGLAEGVSLDDALSAVEALPPTPGRLEAVPLANGAFLLRDDHKAALETVDSALDVLAQIPAARRIVVLGDVEEPPESAYTLYERLGARVASVAQRAVFVHHYWNGPRYAASAAQAGLRSDSIADIRHGVSEAARAVEADLRAGDVVLVKGGVTQRLERVALALAGRRVGCRLRTCEAKATRCGGCPMLERGWDGARVVI